MKRVKNILMLINCIIVILFLKGCSERKIEIRCEETSPSEIYTDYSYTITNGGATVQFSQGASILESKEDKEEVIISKYTEIMQEINPVKANISEDTFIGVNMPTINYLSNDRIVIHGSFGLLIYDLNKEEIISGIDVKSIGCNSTQGDNVCVASVSENGNIVRLHPSSSEDMYVYNVEKNTLIKTKYYKSDDEIKIVRKDESFDTYDGEYSYSYVQGEDGEVSYLRCPIFNRAIDLQYIQGDKVYNIFK